MPRNTRGFTLDDARRAVARLIPEPADRNGIRPVSPTLLARAMGASVGTARASGNRTQYYDSSGKLLGWSSQSGSGSSAQFYDSTGRSLGTQRRSGSAQALYDSSGRLSSTARPSGGTVNFYGPTGASLSTQRHQGASTTFQSRTGSITGRSRTDTGTAKTDTSPKPDFAPQLYYGSLSGAQK